MQTDVAIIGGGAAGFFAAINIAEQNPSLKVIILERSKEVLSKVRISGGGRCNVTHAEFLPKDLSLNYPRGSKELLGPFHTFMTGDTVAWFEERGVPLKIEADGRMFPESNSSQIIIDCFLKETERLHIKVLKSHGVKRISKKETGWQLETSQTEVYAEKLLVATGSSPKVWQLLEKLGHSIIPPVPSLFTFNIKDPRIEGLMGLSTEAQVSVPSAKLESDGPLLITHWGMSGPAILKLSAWGAKELHDSNYQFKVKVNWLQLEKDDILRELNKRRQLDARQKVAAACPFELPKRLWQQLVVAADITSEVNWASISKQQTEALVAQLCEGSFQVNGKSTFKEEFVTAGGIDLKEVNFKTFESKVHPNLFFAGEVLNIDAITGGFNFQNAWTGAYLAARAIAKAT